MPQWRLPHITQAHAVHGLIVAVVSRSTVTSKSRVCRTPGVPQQGSGLTKNLKCEGIFFLEPYGYSDCIRTLPHWPMDELSLNYNFRVTRIPDFFICATHTPTAGYITLLVATFGG